MSKSVQNILFIEDEEKTWEDLKDFFQDEINNGIVSVDFASTASEGLRKVSNNSIQTNLVIIDIILPDLPKDNELFLIKSLDKQIINSNQITKGILTSAHKDLRSLKIIENQMKWIVNSFAKPYGKNSMRNTVLEVLNLNNDNSVVNSFRDEIGEELYEEINQETNAIKFKLRRSVTDLIDAGKRIKLVKYKLPHGYFRRWINTELQVHFSTVNNLLRVAEVFGDDVEKISKIGVVPTILYFLASPSTPPKAREKVIQLIEDGENVSFEQTKKIIKDYKQQNKNLNQENLSIPSASSIQNISPEQKIIKVIPSANAITKPKQWYLLDNIQAYHGKPDDIEFRQSLPDEIALTIAFPPNKSYSLEQLVPVQSRSFNLFYSPFKDLEASEFTNMVKEAVELCTEGSENVLFSYLPGLELIQIAIELGCKCIVVEEDYSKLKKISENSQSL